MENIIKGFIGKNIMEIEVTDTNIFVRFDEQTLVLFDNGQQCCEYRYFHTDSDLEYYKKSVFLGIRETDIDYDGDIEITTLWILTNKGEFDIIAHNEHNGYYGGFDITAELA
jgi:hypothetical protein